MPFTDLIQDLLNNISVEMVIYFFLGTLLIFILIREFYTWYFKLNKLVKLQTAQNEMLESILSELKKK